MTSAKVTKILSLIPISTTIHKSYLPTLDVLNCYQTPAPGHGASRFLSKTLIMRPKYYLIGFSFANALNIYSFQKYNKTEKKVNTPYPSPLSSMAVDENHPQLSAKLPKIS